MWDTLHDGVPINQSYLKCHGNEPRFLILGCSFCPHLYIMSIAAYTNALCLLKYYEHLIGALDSFLLCLDTQAVRCNKCLSSLSGIHGNKHHNQKCQIRHIIFREKQTSILPRFTYNCFAVVCSRISFCYHLIAPSVCGWISSSLHDVTKVRSLFVSRPLCWGWP